MIVHQSQLQHFTVSNESFVVNATNRNDQIPKHSMDYLRQHVPKLMSTFEPMGGSFLHPNLHPWPITKSITRRAKFGAIAITVLMRNGNANSERQSLENRIQQLETLLREEHGVVNCSHDLSKWCINSIRLKKLDLANMMIPIMKSLLHSWRTRTIEFPTKVNTVQRS